MIASLFNKRVFLGSGESYFRPLFPVIFLILFYLLIPLSALATDISTSSQVDSIFYGEYSSGEIIYDTLAISDLVNGELVRVNAVDSDQTCDCVTSSILEDGRVAISLYLDPTEPSGQMEKILYVFSESKVNDLLRIKLRAIHNKNTESHPYSSGIDANSTDFVEKSTEKSVGGKVLIRFFYSPGCISCRKIKTQVLPQVVAEWGDGVSVEEINIDNADGYLQMLGFREKLEIKETRSPYLIIVGNNYIVENENTYEELNRVINEQIKNASNLTVNTSSESAPFEVAAKYLKSFTLWTVVGAGLLDGINPCAFATLVFFIGLLRYVGSSKKDVLIVGIGFTASVFVVYLLLGLGAFKILQSLAVYSVVSLTIYVLTVLLLFVLLVLSIKDTLNYYRTGKTSDASLQLPTKTKQRIHRVMKKGLGARNLLLGAVGIGVLVTLFEAACTGQVYLPTIVLVLKDDLTNSRAFAFLILYNLMFILPLVAVFGLVYAGTSSDTFIDWSKRNYGLTRILLSFLFLLMFLMMLWQVLQLL